MVKSKKWKIYIYIPLLILFIGVLRSGTTGKIMGRVIDKTTKEPLPAANVVVEGTTLGAATDIDGFFVILNVPPGTYKLRASYLGYNDMIVENVRVEADRTIEVNFDLISTAIVTEEVVVRAREPIIKKDVTASVSIVKKEDVQALPVAQVSEIVTRTAGVIEREGTLHVRGGRWTETIYVVDGVEIRDPYTNYSFSAVPFLSVEETAISRGGFDVDQGTVASGAISLVTREGGPRYEFNTRLVTTDFSFLGDKVYSFFDRNFGDIYYDFITGKNLDLRDYRNRHKEKRMETQFAIGGPVFPNDRKGAKFFLSSSYDNSHDRFPNFMDPQKRRWNESYNWKISLPYKSIKFYSSGFYYRELSRDYSASWRFALDNLPLFNDRRFQFIFGINHIVSPKTYWELRFGMFRREFTNNVTEDVDGDGVDDFDDRDRDGLVEIDLDYFTRVVVDTFRTWGRIDSVRVRYERINLDSLYLYISPGGDTLRPIINEDEGFVELPYYWWDTRVMTLYPSIGSGPPWWLRMEYRDPVTGEIIPYNTLGWGSRSNIDMWVLEVRRNDGDIDTVIQMGNVFYRFPYTWPRQLYEYSTEEFVVLDTLLKIGNVYLPDLHTWYRVPYYYGRSGYTTLTWRLNSQVTKNHEILAGFEYKDVDISRYAVDYVSGGNTYFSLLNPPVEPRPGDPYNVIHWFKDNPLKPKIIAAYLRDKIEIEGMVAKVGLRLDWYDPGGFTFSDSLDPFKKDTIWRNLETLKNPIRAKSKFYISPRIGISHPISERDVLHFTYGHYFQIPPFSNIIASYVFGGAFPIIGNANISPEKTISYEFGVKHAFTPEILVDVTAFYKDIRDWARIKMYTTSGGRQFGYYVNEDWGSVRGVEIKFEKRPGGTFLPFFFYDITYTFQVAKGSFSAPRNAYEWAWRGYPLPSTESPLDWDQRNNLILTLGITVPRNIALFGQKYLSDFGFSVSHWYGSGYPFTPPIHTLRDAIERINAERLPSTQRTDLRFFKGFNFGPLNGLLSLDIFNLFDRKDLSSPEDIQWYYQFKDPEAEVKNPAVWLPRRNSRISLELNVQGF